MSCKKCQGSSVETCDDCKSCQKIVRCGVRQTLKQKCEDRKCKEGYLKPEEQEACPVANLGERKCSTTEITGKRWLEFFQQLEKPSEEKKRGEVIKSFQYMKTIKVSKSPDHVIKSFLIEWR
jgi:hypothetical protein